MMKYDIPFNKPFTTGRELDYIQQAIDHLHLSGNGAFTQKCQEWLTYHIGCRSALLTHSGTSALEMAAMLLNIQPGDEVIVPSFTFVSAVNAFVLRGGVPIFIDIRPDTLNLNDGQLERLLTPRTKAIVPMHYGGVGCEMDTVMSIARHYGVAVIEDNTHGLMGQYHQRNLGTFGELAVQSFHETKNVICGEGGALLINDPQYAERAEILWEKGTNRGKFFRGEVDAYTWIDLGSSYQPSEIQAAFLYAQLEDFESIQPMRRKIWHYYEDSLRDWAIRHGVQLPVVPAHCTQPYHLFHLLLPTAQERKKVIRHLNEQGIQGIFHYQPLHLSKMGRTLGGRQGDCPVTEDVSQRLLRLPFYNNLSIDEQAQVVEAVTSAL